MIENTDLITVECPKMHTDKLPLRTCLLRKAIYANGPVRSRNMYEMCRDCDCGNQRMEEYPDLYNSCVNRANKRSPVAATIKDLIAVELPEETPADGSVTQDDIATVPDKADAETSTPDGKKCAACNKFMPLHKFSKYRCGYAHKCKSCTATARARGKNAAKHIGRGLKISGTKISDTAKDSTRLHTTEQDQHSVVTEVLTKANVCGGDDCMLDQLFDGYEELRKKLEESAASDFRSVRNQILFVLSAYLKESKTYEV